MSPRSVLPFLLAVLPATAWSMLVGVCDGGSGQFCVAPRRAYRPVHASGSRLRGLTMLRNFDLPECVVFYGLESVVSSPLAALAGPAQREGNSHFGVSRNVLQPGVTRLLDECTEVGTAAVLLSERHGMDDLRGMLSACEGGILCGYEQSGVLCLRSSLDDMHPSFLEPSEEGGNSEKVDEWDEWDSPHIYNLGSLGQSPSPALLLDALHSVTVVPRGFGGSSGFGTKAADPPRPPIPKHVVVFVPGNSEHSRARCTAARAAGCRVVYLEGEELGSCDAEDLADAVVPSLGGADDWEVVTLDGISTPGEYWLNPPQPRDDEGYMVKADDVVEHWKLLRSRETMCGGTIVETEHDGEIMGEDEMAAILADLDPL